MKFSSYILGLVFLCPFCFSQRDIKFNNITVEDGLSYSLVFEILKDDYGFMWFGTTDGLNKYDGHTFTIYQNIPGDTTSLSDNSVWALFEDSKGNLWVGTDGGGLSLYNRETDSFQHFKNDPNNSSSLAYNTVNDIVEDKDGTIWIGTYGGGVSKMISPGIFQNYAFNENDINSISSNVVNDLFIDSQNRLWAGTQQGLSLFDRSEQSFKRYTKDENFVNDNILCIAEDKNGTFWLASWGGGLFSFKPESLTFEQFLINDTPSRVAYAFVDSKGDIWAGFMENGLVKVDEGQSGLITYVSKRQDHKSLVNNSVWFIYEDDLANIWLGTEGGISWFETNGSAIKAHDGNALADKFSNTVITGFHQDENDQYYFSTEAEVGSMKYNHEGELRTDKLFEVQSIWSSLISKNGEIWVSSHEYGVYRYDSSLSLIAFYQEIDGNTLENASYLFEDEEGTIWVGTFGNGLFSYNPLNGKFRYYVLADSNKERSAPVLTISKNGVDSLWIGTYGNGLLNLDIKSGRFSQIGNDGIVGKSLAHNTVLSILDDGSGEVWIGTDGGGLNQLNKKSGEIQFVTTRDGLPSNVVLGIVKDDKGNLWLSSNEGITKYDPGSDIIKNYDITNGLVSKGFNPDAYFRSTHGVLFFGSGNGFNYFHPDSLKPSRFTPPVYFTDLKILNESQEISGDKLNKHINFTKSITLEHTEDLFTVEFVALDYTSPTRNQYAYRLNGFSENWIYVDAFNRQATFTNLDDGDYLLEIKATNSDGVWSENIASLSIHVMPPPWRTWWAYVVYVVSTILILGLVIRTFTIRERLKSNLKIEQLERKKMEEMDELKSKFFTGISHEFRTPLTLISTPLDQLAKKHQTDIETSHTVGLIKRNAERLLRLINQLLDLSRLEAGQLKLQVHKSDFVQWLKPIVASFESYADSKKLNFDTFIPISPIQFYFDKNKLEHVVLNLLSNAFKFASKWVLLSVELDDDMILIRVENDGPTIPKEELDKIFDRFYQYGQNQSAEGTGIGLALVKEFSSIHHGEVSVVSDQEKTSFCVTLPIKDSYYEKDIKVELEKTKVFEAVQEQDFQDIPSVVSGKDQEKTNVLIVEDNLDLRAYMADQLSTDYQVLQAENGRVGLEQSLSEIPDLIITDIMMPEMDGIDLLASIRNDHRTNHIPVIMLTAKSERETRLSGIEKGADHYLSKPFDIEELMVRIRSLISQRERIKSHYYNEFLINPKSEDISSLEDTFLKNSAKVIESELSNHEFTVDQFARELSMSRAQLHRKMKAILGCSASEFIRNFRLKKAYDYLESRKESVSQVAYSVGFNNLSYFTRAFKSVYNIPPSEVCRERQ